MLILKQSTAVDVLIGPFLDSTDGYTAEVGLSPSVKLSKNGQALAAKNDVTTPVHDADGYYNCELDATDTNTVGTLVLSVVGSATSLPVRHEFQVMEEATYDFLYASGATPIADINAECDTAITDASLATSAALATVDSNVDAILVDTAEIGAAGAGLTAVPWNASWDAEVQSEVQDAIEVNHLDHLLAVDYDPASKPGIATALLNELVENDAGESRFTVNALENAPSGSGASAATIADAVWDEARADHVSAGSFGEGVKAESLNTQAKADVNAEADTAISDASLATAAALATVDGNVDAILVDTGTTIPGVLGTPAGADLATDVAAVKTDTGNIETDTQDIQSRLPAALVSGRMSADAVALSGSTTAADNLQRGAEALVLGAVSGAGSTTTSIDTGLTEATDDHYNGRVITFTSGVLAGQTTDITDYNGTTKALTVTALTEAPGDTDTFVIS